MVCGYTLLALSVSMTTFPIIFSLGLLGLCLGSFANAAVWRIKNRRDIMHERSECVHCHHQLAWYDLVPVFSWVTLRGKCRYCKKAISPQYPLVELAVAVYFVGSYFAWPLALNSAADIILFALWLSFGVGLAILFVYDLRWFLLPDRVVFPLISLGLVAFVVRETLLTPFEPVHFLSQLVLSLLPIAGFYFVLHVISKGEWVGFGDVKLGIFMGLALGWPLALLTLVLANVLGCVVTIPGLLSKKLSRASKVPFGPFLIVAFIISGLFGTPLINWYLAGIGLAY